MWATLLIWLLFDVLMLASFFWLPVMRGCDAFFGVRVSEEFYRSEGRRMLHRYWFWLLMVFIEVEVLGLLVSFFRAELPLARVASTPLVVLPAFILYILFYRQVKPFAATPEHERFASALKLRHLSDYTNIYLEIAVLLLIVAPTFLLIYYYPHLPEKIPVHWDWRGRPDQWARKSFGAVFFLSALLIYMQGLFLLIKRGLLTVKMTLPAERAEEYLEGKEKFLRATMHLMDWVRVLTATMMCGVLLQMIFSNVEHLRPWATLALIVSSVGSVLLTAGIIYFIVRLIMIDRELKKRVGRVYVQRKHDAAHWYLGGLFYCNREDPSLFVEKMVGFGYTFNMGNPMVYVYLAYILMFPLLTSLLFKEF